MITDYKGFFLNCRIFFKIFFISSILIGCLIEPPYAFSSYLIQSKSGADFVTEQYWRKGDLVMFYYRGGILGLETAWIKDISEVDAGYREVPPEIEPALSERQEPEKKPASKPEQIVAEGKTGVSMAARDRIIENYVSVRRTLHQAILNQDKAATMEAEVKLKELRDEYDFLEKELKAITGGELPSWWNERLMPD